MRIKFTASSAYPFGPPFFTPFMQSLLSHKIGTFLYDQAHPEFTKLPLISLVTFGGNQEFKMWLTSIKADSKMCIVIPVNLSLNIYKQRLFPLTCFLYLYHEFLHSFEH